jgi:hypothetical protein
MPSPLELAARGRRDAEDARCLKQWKRDPEVYAQIGRSIAARHEREQEIDRREARKAERKAEILEAERIERDSLTPLSHMHSANFIAFSCVAAVLLLLPVPAGAFEQPATITRAWQGRPAAISFYSCFLPACGDCVDTASLSSVQPRSMASWRSSWWQRSLL